MRREFLVGSVSSPGGGIERDEQRQARLAVHLRFSALWNLAVIAADSELVRRGEDLVLRPGFGPQSGTLDGFAALAVHSA